MTTVPTPTDGTADPLAELRTADPATFEQLNEMARAHIAGDAKAFAEAFVRATMSPQDAQDALAAVARAKALHAEVLACCSVLSHLMVAEPSTAMNGEQALAIWDANGANALHAILISAAAHIDDVTGSDGPQRSQETVVELADAAGASVLAEISGGAS